MGQEEEQKKNSLDFSFLLEQTGVTWYYFWNVLKMRSGCFTVKWLVYSVRKFKFTIYNNPKHRKQNLLSTLAICLFWGFFWFVVLLLSLFFLGVGFFCCCGFFSVWSLIWERNKDIQSSFVPKISLHMDLFQAFKTVSIPTEIRISKVRDKTFKYKVFSN